MLMTQSISEINVLLLRQLSSFFVLSEDDKKAVEQSVPCALDKCERSFRKPSQEQVLQRSGCNQIRSSSWASMVALSLRAGSLYIPWGGGCVCE